MTEHGHGDCCAPVRAAKRRLPPGAVAPASPPSDVADLVAIDGGWFQMGSDDVYAYEEDGEGPVRSVRVDPFRIAARCVSNRQFAEFVDATGYVTSAERYGVSFVFGGLLPDDFPPTRAVAAAQWWREVPGAYWRRPEGGRSTHRRQGRPSGGPCVLGRRPCLLPVVGPAPSYRGGMGVRRPRRPRRHALPLGQHAPARRRAPHERLAGRVSHPEHPGRRLPRHRTGGRVRTKRLRPLQHDREHMGVDG